MQLRHQLCLQQSFIHQALVDQTIQPLWQWLGMQKVHGLTVPQKDQGLNMGYLAHGLTMMELSKIAPSLGLSYLAHSNLCIDQISRHGTSTQKKDWLHPLLNGSYIGALAISEEEAGSDALNIQTTAEKTDKGYYLNGRKCWLTNGSFAHIIVLYARMKANPNQLTAFVLDPATQTGLCRGTPLAKMGMHYSNTINLELKRCFVPQKNILGNIGQGKAIMMSGLNYERLLLAFGPLGIMEACFDLVVPYVNKRFQFSKPLAQCPIIQSKIGSMYRSFQAAKCFAFTQASLADKRPLARIDAAAVFAQAAHAAKYVADETVQLLGGNGYTQAYRAQSLYCDAKLYEIGGGTQEIRHMLIGRELLHNHASRIKTPDNKHV
jgi:isovaleryl-CoA dehydrogenase